MGDANCWCLRFFNSLSAVTEHAAIGVEIDLVIPNLMRNGRRLFRIASNLPLIIVVNPWDRRRFDFFVKGAFAQSCQFIRIV